MANRAADLQLAPSTYVTFGQLEDPEDPELVKDKTEWWPGRGH